LADRVEICPAIAQGEMARAIGPADLVMETGLVVEA
jgi:hypothetical protein